MRTSVRCNQKTGFHDALMHDASRSGYAGSNEILVLCGASRTTKGKNTVRPVKRGFTVSAEETGLGTRSERKHTGY